MAKGYDKTKSSFADQEKFSDLVAVLDKQEFTNKYRSYRPVGGVVNWVEMWFPIFKDGKPMKSEKTGRVINTLRYATNWDQEEEVHTKKSCPYILLADKVNEFLDEKMQVRPRKMYAGNFISRALQDSMPRKAKLPSKSEAKTKFKESLNSPSWTPMVVAVVTSSVMRKIVSKGELNIVKDKKTGEEKIKEPSDPRYGFDLKFKYLPKETGSAMYDVDRGGRSPLTDEEKEYLLWDIDGALAQILETNLKESKAGAANLEKMYITNKVMRKKKDEDGEEDMDEDDYIEGKKKKKKRIEDNDEDDDEKPTKKKKSPWNDDDSSLDDDDDDDKPKSKKNKKPKNDDDDDDDDLSSNLDDDEDEKPVKKKKRPVDDDDDEDEKPVKKKKRPVDDDDDEDEKPVKKKKRPVDDDEDNDDDLDDLDDDDEDEKPVKKKKKR